MYICRNERNPLKGIATPLLFQIQSGNSGRNERNPLKGIATFHMAIRFPNTFVEMKETR